MADRIYFNRFHGRKLPVGAKFVGRPGRFGNPFKVDGLVMDPAPPAGCPQPYFGPLLPGGPFNGLLMDGTLWNYTIHVVADRAEAVAWYERWLRHQPAMIASIRSDLAGKDLACTCPVDGLPCHGDVQLRVAAGGEP